MAELQIIAKIDDSNIESLLWCGDALIDWVGGGKTIELDGRTVSSRVFYAYRFDAAVMSPSGRFVFIYERLGTKGLLLQNTTIVREVDRSYYHANVYEYPVCFATLPNGREALIHCPEDYCRLEIEDAETGERLTESATRKPADFFHSRLVVDASNRWLLSAGWFWHPFDAAKVFSIAEAIANPPSIDDSELFPLQSVEISTATFRGSSEILVSTSKETFSEGEYAVDEFEPSSIGVWDIANRSIRFKVPISEPAGNLMPINEDYAVAFYKHPKLVNLRTGEITNRIPELNCGEQTSSIIHHHDKPPAIACDVAKRRFAVATDKQVVVVQYIE